MGNYGLLTVLWGVALFALLLLFYSVHRLSSSCATKLDTWKASVDAAPFHTDIFPSSATPDPTTYIMPLPAHSFTLSGGCSCRAIRYKSTFQPLSERAIHPTADQDDVTRGAVRLPFVAICHCNDCRQATGSILFLAFARLWRLSRLHASLDRLRLTCFKPPKKETTTTLGDHGFLPKKFSYLGREAADTFLSSY